jgi:hypothetical protein
MQDEWADPGQHFNLTGSAAHIENFDLHDA